MGDFIPHDAKRTNLERWFCAGSDRKRRRLAHRRHFDRDAVEHGVAGDRVEEQLVGEHVGVDARRGRPRRGARAPARRGPQPCGIETTPGMTSSVISTRQLDRAGARADAHELAVGEAEAAPRRPDAATPCSAPARSPAAAGCASTSCSSAGRGGRRAPCRRWRARPSPRAGASTSATIGSGASSTCPLGVRSTSGSRGSSGPRSMPCGAASQVRERQVVGAGAQQHVEQPLGPAQRRPRGSAPLSRREPRAATKSSSALEVRVRRPARSTIAVSASSVSHSWSIPSGGSISGGEKFAMLRTEKLVEGEVVVRLLDAATARAGSRRRGAWSR